MSKDGQELDLKSLEIIDQILSQTYTPTKDSSEGVESGESRVHTKVYEIPIKGEHPKIVKIRLWFDGKNGKGSIKTRHIPYSLVAAAGSYTVIQAGVVIQQILQR